MPIVLVRPVARVVQDQRGRELVVKVTQEGVYLREKRRRSWYGPLEWGWLFMRGAHLEADREREERAKTRPAKKKRVTRGFRV